MDEFNNRFPQDTDELPRRGVLDHGYVVLRNIAGPTRRPHSLYDADSIDPANAARMTFGKMNSGRTREEDLGLVDFLSREGHWVPFEHIQVWLEIKAPIFVLRQWAKHRTTTISEISGRYVELPPHWYIPETIKMQSKNRKQGGDAPAIPELAEQYICDLSKECQAGYEKYKHYMGQGVSTELCRNYLHVNHYSTWLYRQDLRNLFGFLKQRCSTHGGAQWEIAQYAQAVLSLLMEVLPEATECLASHGGITLEEGL